MIFDDIFRPAFGPSLFAEAAKDTPAQLPPVGQGRLRIEPNGYIYDLPTAVAVRSLLSSDEARYVWHVTSSPKDAGSLPVETVATESIIPTQFWVSRKTVNDLLDAGHPGAGSADEPVVLFRKHGNVYVADGHHRLVAASQRGDAGFTGRMIDFDNGSVRTD